MILSDALPVQFWPVNCDTYNETVNKGIHQSCFSHPWNCDDEIVTQFTNDEFTFADPEAVTIPTFILWSTQSTTVDLVNWTIGTSPSVTVEVGSSSEILYTDFDFIVGARYSITINYTSSASSSLNSVLLRIYNDDFVVQFSSSDTISSGSNSVTLTFVATSECTKIGVYVSNIVNLETSNNVTITCNSRSATIETVVPVPYNLVVVDEDGNDLAEYEFASDVIPDTTTSVYITSFTPSEASPEICNQQIRLEIRNSETSEVVAKSDSLYTRDEHLDPTILISYTNHRNFSGLIYADVSPDPEFKIRVPARFFHERYPEEDESLELSSSVVNTASELKTQRLLEVLHVPYYFHKKLKLILKHQTVTIEGYDWVKEEVYEISEGNKKWPKKTATCYLTQKNSLVRNVL